MSVLNQTLVPEALSYFAGIFKSTELSQILPIAIMKFHVEGKKTSESIQTLLNLEQINPALLSFNFLISEIRGKNGKYAEFL